MPNVDILCVILFRCPSFFSNASGTLLELSGGMRPGHCPEDGSTGGEMFIKGGPAQSSNSKGRVGVYDVGVGIHRASPRLHRIYAGVDVQGLDFLALVVITGVLSHFI